MSDDTPTSAAPGPDPQEVVDAEHLRILAICYYVMGGVVIFFSCFALLYVVFGLLIALDSEVFHNPQRPHDGPPPELGYVLAVMGGVFVALGWTFGGLTIFAGRSMQRRRRRTLTLVLAALYCLWIPFGTLLGIFTFIVLMRPSVMRLYDERAQWVRPLDASPETR